MAQEVKHLPSNFAVAGHSGCIFNLSTQEAETEGLCVGGQPRLHSEFQGNQG
jgi:hypothetical protein